MMLRTVCRWLLTLCVLPCVVFLYGRSVQAQTNRQGAFSVYDGLGYKNKPDLTAFGLKALHIAYTSEIWNGAAAREEPDETAVRKLARKIPANVPLVLDVEHWKIQGQSKDTEDNINKLMRIADWVHAENPNLKVGYFGLAPISNPWRELSYVRAADGPRGSGSAKVWEAYREMQGDNARMARLAFHVDFVCPVIYTFNNLNGAAYENSWDKMAVNAINEARQYHKPIYPFVWPQFYDLKDSSGDNTFLPEGFWKHELELLRGGNVDGLIVWASPTFRKAGWNENDPWWLATDEFIKGLNRPGTGGKRAHYRHGT